MSKIITLPTSALYVPESELSEFTSVFNCNPDALGTIQLTVSDEASKLVRGVVNYSVTRRVALTTPDTNANYFSAYWCERFNITHVHAGLINVQHNLPGTEFCIRRVDVFRDPSFGPRLHVKTVSGCTHWWLYYKLDRTPMCAALTPSIRFKIDYQDEDNSITER